MLNSWNNVNPNKNERPTSNIERRTSNEKN
jgi:hypothetical protein